MKLCNRWAVVFCPDRFRNIKEKSIDETNKKNRKQNWRQAITKQMLNDQSFLRSQSTILF